MKWRKKEPKEKLLDLEIIFDLRLCISENYPEVKEEVRKKYVEANELLIDMERRICQYIKTGKE